MAEQFISFIMHIPNGPAFKKPIHHHKSVLSFCLENKRNIVQFYDRQKQGRPLTTLPPQHIALNIFASLKPFMREYYVAYAYICVRSCFTNIRVFMPKRVAYMLVCSVCSINKKIFSLQYFVVVAVYLIYFTLYIQRARTKITTKEHWRNPHTKHRQ